ncbi:hypothetical protein [Phytohabitans suffuscus]|uniref:Uncharacterized protein n=1 Tax=Phytohabitans suffuscus TaxID=624315 RepID=A0A6F8YKQ1_9ACTN|nr:hypothetical protein [Phytohabitans suffuscus]BCB86599.1 hypothetical protein Psuf_039120 [Phytohabitans suffuscus]
MQFQFNGVTHHLDPATVIERVRGAVAEPVRAHGVRIGGVTYPVKQAFELASNIARAEFTSHTAIRHLRALGFGIVGPAGSPDGHRVPVARAAVAAVQPGREWPWEGTVQALFVDLLREHGWSIIATADTATKAPGVDVLADRRERQLGAEVKGWPSAGYADPRRAAEVKRTQPSTQAGHWFSQALFKAIMLLDSHPGHESLIVLPDYPRYRDLAERTRTGRQAANIHVVLLAQDGTHTSETWTP